MLGATPSHGPWPPSNGRRAGDLALTAAACSGDLPSVAPTCDDREALKLMAQAVPEADAVPCFDQIPFGYRATTFDVGQGEVELALSHAVVGLDAVTFHLAAICTPADGGEPLPRPEPGDRVESVQANEQGHVEGHWIEAVGDACLVVTFDLPHVDADRAFDDVAGTWRLARFAT